jgi:hypothetical protein
LRNNSLPWRHQQTLYHLQAHHKPDEYHYASQIARELGKEYSSYKVAWILKDLEDLGYVSSRKVHYDDEGRTLRNRKYAYTGVKIPRWVVENVEYEGVK